MVHLKSVVVSIERALQFIENNLEKTITLEEVARESGMSRSHFTRIFKKITGKSFKKYLNQKRIKRAKYLLKGQEMNITEVCFTVGFNDLSYFDRVFRRLEGMPPSAYKKNFLI